MGADWTSDGLAIDGEFAIVQAEGSQSPARLSWNATKQDYQLAWQDSRVAWPNGYGRRLTSSGLEAGPEFGMPVSFERLRGPPGLSVTMGFSGRSLHHFMPQTQRYTRAIEDSRTYAHAETQPISDGLGHAETHAHAETDSHINADANRHAERHADAN